MLTLLLGTDWVANRDALYGRIADDVAQKKGGRILMVPELISHDAERRLCSVAGDTASRFAEVLSFTRLADRVADSVGHAAGDCLDNGGRVVAMASVAQQLHSRLKAYASVETCPEFLVELVDAVDEFKRCCISAQDLLTASTKTEGSLAQKLKELSLILETYDALCLHGKRDPRDRMAWLFEELEESEFAQDHFFYIDGFPDFTRQHMAIIEHFMRCSENVVISLTCDKPASTLLAFEKAGRTAQELIQIAERSGIACQIHFVNSRMDSLEYLRQNIFQGNIDPDRALPQVRTYRIETIYQECIAAVEQVIGLVQSGSRYRDINLVCTDLSAYRTTLEMVFQRAHIPLYLSGTEDILGKPVIAAVLNTVDTVLGGFEREDVLRYLKSIISPLPLATCDKIENYTILWNISGSGWLQEWTEHPNGLGKIHDDDSDSILLELNSARKIVMGPLERLSKGFRAAKNIGKQIEVLCVFLEEINLRDRLDELAQQMDNQADNRSAQILNQLWEIMLKALEQMHDILGKNSWDYQTFTRLLRLLLSQYDVGTIPPVLDAVSVGTVNVMRCQQAKHLIVLGAIEGNLPGYGGSSGVLTDNERVMLREMGVPLTGGALDGLQSEFAEIYGVFSSAEESITVSCPGGQPSFIYRRLCEIAGGEESPGDCLGAALTDPVEASALLARFGAASAAESLGIGKTYREIFEKRAHELGEIQADNIKKIYGQYLYLSASQIDCQAECRFAYFLKYGLRAKEQRQAAIDPAEFGTYVHAVLENTARKIKEAGGFSRVSMEDALRFANAFSKIYMQERFHVLSTERMQYLFNRNSRELELIVKELWSELHWSKFEPVDFEVAFGDGATYPAIPIPGQFMDAKIRGFVDRVDTWQDGDKNYFRVVDYKTGRKDFDYCDIFNGLGLQMLLYLFALEQQGEQMVGSAAIPAGVQYFPARVPFVSADSQLSDQEAAAAREKLWKRKGLILSDANVLQAMESEDAPNRMPYNQKKDGSIVGDLATSRQFKLLKAYVFRLLGKMVDEIASGRVSPNPYTRGSSHDACAFCPYYLVCHHEKMDERRNYKMMTAQRFWDEVEKEVSRRG